MGVKKLLFLGSSCIYPKFSHQPITEDMLLMGELEPTNEPYAIAKISGIKMCKYNRQYGHDYRCVMPTNLYGPGDNYDRENSHVIPGLIRRFHEAKVSGKKKLKSGVQGSSKREFYLLMTWLKHVFLFTIWPKQISMKQLKNVSHINIGTGQEITISALAEKIEKLVGFDGKLILITQSLMGLCANY